jgi:ABC-type transporter Mla MlaB component
MLKITEQTEIPEMVRVSLSGHFTSEYVPEVEKALVQNGNKSKTCALDLLNVTFVDRSAMEFLRAAQSRKIKLENLPSWVKRWIQLEAGNGASSFKPR